MARGAGVVITQRSSFLLALALLELITIGGFFLVLGSQTQGQKGAASLLGSDGRTISAFRGDLIPPPEVLAKDIVYNASFLQSNDLKAYLAAFPPQFAEHLLQLGPRQRILDAGAGEALFAEQIVSLNKDPSPHFTFSDERAPLFKDLLIRPSNIRPTVVAVDVEIKRKSIPSFNGKLEVLSGRLFEEIPSDLLGTFDLIVDNQGVFAYTPNLDEVLKRYLRSLRKGGAIYLALGSETSSFAFLSRVQTAKQGSMNLVDWIFSIQGLRVQLGIADRDRRALRIETTSSDVAIPKLRLISVEPRGAEPPVRFYAQD